MEYRVVSAPSLDTLEDTVNPLICAGWEPQGGVSATLLRPGHNGKGMLWRYHQAMVKHYRRFTLESGPKPIIPDAPDAPLEPPSDSPCEVDANPSD